LDTARTTILCGNRSGDKRMTSIETEVRPGIANERFEGHRSLRRLSKGWFWIATLSILLLLGVELFGSIRDESETMDESVHLVSGYTYWKTGDFRLNPEHPPLTKLLEALPLLFLRPALPGDQRKWRSDNVVAYSQEFLYRNRKPADTLLFAGRCVTIAFTLLFGLLLALWCRSRFGELAALFTLLLLAVDPNLIAHGRYVTSDLLVTMAFFFTCVSWSDWLEHRTFPRLIGTAVLFGLTQTVKYSGLVLIPVFIALYILDWYRKRQKRGLQWKEMVTVSSVIAVVSFVMVWASFGFVSKPLLSDEVAAQRFNEKFGHPERSRVDSSAFATEAASPVHRYSPRTISAMRWLGSNVPVPAHYFVLGIYKLSDHARRGHDTYLLGMNGKKGWWYYFPVAMLVKTLTAVELLVILCAALVARHWRRYRSSFSFLWLSLICAPLIYLVVSCSGNLNLGLRHILPVYPFLYVLIGAVLFDRSRAAIGVTWQLLALGLGLAALGESLSAYPNYLPFFNVLAGGPSNGPRYLLDSNLDWGQDLKKLAQFRAGRESQAPLCLEYHGPAEPAYYGIRYQALPPLENEKAVAALNCEVAISVDTLYSHPDTYRALLRRSPEKRIGYSIYVYEPRLERAIR